MLQARLVAYEGQQQGPALERAFTDRKLTSQQQGPALERPALELPNVPELPRHHEKLHEPELPEPPPYAKRARLAEHEEGSSSTLLGNYSGLSGKLYRAWDAQDDAFEGEGGHGQHGSISMKERSV